MRYILLDENTARTIIINNRPKLMYNFFMDYREWYLKDSDPRDYENNLVIRKLEPGSTYELNVKYQRLLDLNFKL